MLSKSLLAATCTELNCFCSLYYSLYAYSFSVLTKSLLAANEFVLVIHIPKCTDLYRRDHATAYALQKSKDDFKPAGVISVAVYKTMCT